MGQGTSSGFFFGMPLDALELQDTSVRLEDSSCVASLPRGLPGEVKGLGEGKVFLVNPVTLALCSQLEAWVSRGWFLFTPADLCEGASDLVECKSP